MSDNNPLTWTSSSRWSSDLGTCFIDHRIAAAILDLWLESLIGRDATIPAVFAGCMDPAMLIGGMQG